MKNDKQEEQVLKRLASIYRPGTLNLIGGRPGMGKTTLAFQLATEAQLPTAYFSLEMKRDPATWTSAITRYGEARISSRISIPS